jgi:hypothetical protein
MAFERGPLRLKPIRPHTRPTSKEAVHRYMKQLVVADLG